MHTYDEQKLAFCTCANLRFASIVSLLVCQNFGVAKFRFVSKASPSTYGVTVGGLLRKPQSSFEKSYLALKKAIMVVCYANLSLALKKAIMVVCYAKLSLALKKLDCFEKTSKKLLKLLWCFAPQKSI